MKKKSFKTASLYFSFFFSALFAILLLIVNLLFWAIYSYGDIERQKTIEVPSFSFLSDFLVLTGVFDVSWSGVSLDRVNALLWIDGIFIIVLLILFYLFFPNELLERQKTRG